MLTRPYSAKPGRGVVAVLVLGGALTLGGCGGKGVSWHTPGEAPSAKRGEISIAQPADGASDVATSAEIVYAAGDAARTDIELSDASGTSITGAMRPDGSSWLPDKQLEYSTRYTVKVTATFGDETATKTSTFTTMAKPANRARVSSYIGDNQVVGVGMPVILTFGVDVPERQRAAVQKRLFVSSEPAQDGAWNWFNAHEVHFRPRQYWQPGTKLSVRAAVGGLPLGDKWYGNKDLTVIASVGPKIIISVSNARHQMTVTKNGRLLRTIPVSMGKPKTPSSSGNMVIMTKNYKEWFDSSSYGVPSDSANGYRTLVYYVLRLTWSGQYIHAAPWSVGDQGRRNVSHGCTNVSTAHAKWLFQLTHIGDPVIVKGTEQHVVWGNGWTDWDVGFEKYAQGSAIPYTPPSASPTPSGDSGAATGTPSATPSDERTATQGPG